LKKLNREKKSIKILKKPTGSVQFRFYKPETKTTKPNRTQTGKKPSQTRKTEPNRFEPVFVLKNQTEPKLVGLNWFRFLKKKFNLVIFLNKNRIQPKIITSIFDIISLSIFFYIKK